MPHNSKNEFTHMHQNEHDRRETADKIGDTESERNEVEKVEKIKQLTLSIHKYQPNSSHFFAVQHAETLLFWAVAVITHEYLAFLSFT